jgi:hypothetical protein
LDFHLTRCHDRHCFGPLPDRHADLEEMFQLTPIYGGTSSGTIGSTHADSQPTPDSPRYTGDQQSGHQIKHVHSHSHQHLVKKLPKKGRDIGTIFKATLTTNFNKTPSAKYILL